MSFLKGLGSVLGLGGAKPPSFGENLMSGISNSISAIPGQAISSTIGGTLEGRAQRRYLQNAYPGTSPHEQLAGSGGQTRSSGTSDTVKAAKIQANTQKEVARINQQTQLGVADKQTEVAKGRWGIEKGYYDQKQKSETEILRTRAMQIEAQSLKEFAGLKYALEMEKLAPQLAKAGLTQARNRDFWNSVANVLGGAGVTQEKVSAAIKPYLPAAGGLAATIATTLFLRRGKIVSALAGRAKRGIQKWVKPKNVPIDPKQFKELKKRISESGAKGKAPIKKSIDIERLKRLRENMKKKSD